VEQNSSEPPEKQTKLSEHVTDYGGNDDPSTSDAIRQSIRIKDKPTEKVDDPVPVERDIIVIRPAPWIRINGSLNRRVADRWISAILLYLITYPGVNLNKLNARFSFLIPVQIRYILGVSIPIY
jgi:general transcription factor 3C polypeptide 1